MSWVSLFARAIVLACLAFVAPGCGEVDRTDPVPALPSPAGSEPTRPSVATARPISLSIGAFSAASEALGVRILPEFATHWQRASGQEVNFVERYDGSGRLAQAAQEGFAADVMLFALTDDMQDLVRSGLLSGAWREKPHQGIVCRSVIALGVRKGNPKAIVGWRDLVRPDVRIVSPDPATSGCGVWNLCALYGAALRGDAGVEAGDAAVARAFVAKVWRNVVAQGKSAREAFKTFQAGVGDVVIIYESEITNAWMFGYTDERVVPRSTLLVESPIAVLDRNADAHDVRAAAEGLLAFLWTPRIQAKLAFCGLRPVDPEVAEATKNQFPQPGDLWTIADLGGWDQAMRDIVGPAGFAIAARPGK